MSRPRVTSVLETVLYARDVRACAAFYTDVLGLAAASEADELSAALRVSAQNVLLIFNPELSEQPGRIVPSHGGHGPGHVALRIEPGEYEEWKARLAAAGVAIEQEHEWVGRGEPWPEGWKGARSIYVRDPAGNSVELITGDIWGGIASA